MKVNELSLGWAMTQPDAAAAVQQVCQNWRKYEQQAARRARRAAAAVREWAARPSDTFNALCATEGERFTHADVVRAHAYLALVAAVMLIASWLEGGAL